MKKKKKLKEFTNFTSDNNKLNRNRKRYKQTFRTVDFLNLEMVTEFRMQFVEAEIMYRTVWVRFRATMNCKNAIYYNVWYWAKNILFYLHNCKIGPQEFCGSNTTLKINIYYYWTLKNIYVPTRDLKEKC